MLNRHDKKLPVQEKMAAFEKACKEAGLKLTHQRLEIYRELAIATDHPSAEMLHKRLQKRIPTISLDTIYRTLYSFEHYNLITRVETVESQARFEAEGRQHHHFICDKCKGISDFQWRSFDESTLPEEVSQWGTIKRKNATIHGTCTKCLEMKQQNKT